MIKKLNILGSEFTIEVVDEPGKDYEEGKYVQAWGYTHWAKGIIEISTKIKGDFAKNTLIHEIVHILGDQLSMSKKLDEKTVDLLAIGLHDLFTHNPDFLKMWLK